LNSLLVLLVEDDEVVHRALGCLIDLLPGCALVGIARTVAQALDEVAQLRPDVLLMSAEVPGALAAINSLRTAAVTPADEAAAALRVVLISVYGRGEQQARAGGADAYVLADCGPWALCAALHGEQAGTPDGAGEATGPCCDAAALAVPVACGLSAPEPERRPPWD
jgi:DNA-binding NarL/FixJ family response regulator